MRLSNGQRWALEDVLRKHGIACHPVTGIGPGQNILEEIVEAIAHAEIDAVDGVATEALQKPPPPPPVEAILEAAKEHAPDKWIKAAGPILKKVWKDWEDIATLHWDTVRDSYVKDIVAGVRAARGEWE